MNAEATVINQKCEVNFVNPSFQIGKEKNRGGKKRKKKKNFIKFTKEGLLRASIQIKVNMFLIKIMLLGWSPVNQIFWYARSCVISFHID